MVPNHDGVGDSRGFNRQSEILLETLPRMMPKIFQPFVRYNQEEDRIEVKTIPSTDFGRTEIIHNLVLYERVPPNELELCIGFCIESARAFCLARGLKSEGNVRVSEILRFMTVFGGTASARPIIDHVLLPLLRNYRIDTFEFPPA